MSLKPGHYRIRIVSVEHPNPGPGGMYLTLAPDGEVLVEAQVPSTFNRQKWHVQAVNGGTDVYTIERPHSGPPEGLKEGLLETNEVRVVFGPHPEEWRISNAGDGDEVYLIFPNKKFPIGVDHLVATDGEKVVVKPFPVVPGDRPAWRFYPDDG